MQRPSRHKLLVGAILMAALFHPPLGSAQEGEDPATPTVSKKRNEKDHWESEAQFSAVINTGNTESILLSGSTFLERRYYSDKYRLEGGSTYGQSEVTDPSTGATQTQTTAQKWSAKGRYDRFLTDFFTWFLGSGIRSDKLSGIDFRYNAQTGITHFLFQTEKNEFRYEAGFDYTYENRTTGTTPPTVNIYSIRTLLGYLHDFNEIVSFSQEVESLFNVEEAEDVRLKSVTEVISKLNKLLSLRAAYIVDVDFQPVSGFEKVDTLTEISLLFTFM